MLSFHAKQFQFKLVVTVDQSESDFFLSEIWSNKNWCIHLFQLANNVVDSRVGVNFKNIIRKNTKEIDGTTMHNEVDALKMDPFPGLFSLDIRKKSNINWSHSHCSHL